ncbi:hypothetical protein GCM10025734_67580 [Kitasatospora paranensis]
MAGAALDGEPHPVHALLRRLDQVQPDLVVDGEGEAPDLADALGDALEQLGVLVDQEAGAVGAAGLLVRDEGEDEVARGLRPVRRRSRTTARVIASMSFMSTAPRPQTQPSAISPPNGSYVQSAALAGTTSVWPWISRPGRERSSPSIRTTVEARPLADS